MSARRLKQFVDDAKKSTANVMIILCRSLQLTIAARRAMMEHASRALRGLISGVWKATMEALCARSMAESVRGVATAEPCEPISSAKHMARAPRP